jgi:hypothetical protein
MSVFLRVCEFLHLSLQASFHGIFLHVLQQAAFSANPQDSHQQAINNNGHDYL